MKNTLPYILVFMMAAATGQILASSETKSKAQDSTFKHQKDYLFDKDGDFLQDEKAVLNAVAKVAHCKTADGKRTKLIVSVRKSKDDAWQELPGHVISNYDVRSFKVKSGVLKLWLDKNIIPEGHCIPVPERLLLCKNNPAPEAIDQKEHKSKSPTCAETELSDADGVSFATLDSQGLLTISRMGSIIFSGVIKQQKWESATVGWRYNGEKDGHQKFNPDGVILRDSKGQYSSHWRPELDVHIVHTFYPVIVYDSRYFSTVQ